MSTKQSKLDPKTKKTLNAVIIAIQVLIIVVCIVFSIVMLVSSMGNKEGELNDIINLMPVMSDSMVGDNPDSFNIDDLILVKKLSDEDKQNLKVGDIVTFKVYDPSLKAVIYKSHRIVKICQEGDPEWNKCDVVTQGDAAQKYIDQDPTKIANYQDYLRYSQIEGIYTGKIPKVGGAITFIKQPAAFFGLIVTPLALLLIYNIVVIVRGVTKAKDEKHKAELEESEAKHRAEMDELKAMIMGGSKPADTPQPSIPLDDKEREEELKKQAIAEYLAEQERKAKEEEIKRKAIEEYLASQANNNDDK
ncbi:MAG: hypothetical protein PUG90_01600 [Clostridia bacterium]|nr:hypothetical protein [Clostridia bacterium]MDY4082884.1 hypothetical protein [Eubacteriales bacterium]